MLKQIGLSSLLFICATKIPVHADAMVGGDQFGPEYYFSIPFDGKQIDFSLYSCPVHCDVNTRPLDKLLLGLKLEMLIRKAWHSGDWTPVEKQVRFDRFSDQNFAYVLKHAIREGFIRDPDVHQKFQWSYPKSIESWTLGIFTKSYLDHWLSLNLNDSHLQQYLAVLSNHLSSDRLNGNRPISYTTEAYIVGRVLARANDPKKLIEVAQNYSGLEVLHSKENSRNRLILALKAEGYLPPDLSMPTPWTQKFFNLVSSKRRRPMEIDFEGFPSPRYPKCRRILNGIRR